MTIDYDTKDFIFGGIILGFFLLSFLSTSYIAIRKEYKLFSFNNTLANFKITFISLLIFFVGLSVHVYLIFRDSSSIVFEAGQNFDLGHINLELREDETYKFTNGFVLGSSYSRGKYTFKDSIIILDRQNLDPLFKSNKLARREDKLYMINDKHKILDSIFFFNIK